jgi:hypothetical protein
MNRLLQTRDAGVNYRFCHYFFGSFMPRQKAPTHSNQHTIKITTSKTEATVKPTPQAKNTASKATIGLAAR